MEGNGDALYRHVPLTDARSIRLLDFAPRDPHQEGIAITLTEVPLDAAPDFIAISYVWGSSTLDHAVWCEGKNLPVTASAAQVLASPVFPFFGFSVWIDSICIDQSSVPERNAQVRLMGDIYRRAARLFIWLGRGDEACELALRYCNEAVLIDTWNDKDPGSSVMDLLHRIETAHGR